MNLASDQFVHDQSAALHAAGMFSNDSFDALEKLTTLNLQVVKTSLSEHRALADAALSATSPFAVFDLHLRASQAAIEKMLAYWRHVGDIAMQTQSQLLSASLDASEAASRSDVAQGGRMMLDTSKRIGQDVGSGIDDAAKQAASIVDSAGNAVSSSHH